MQETWVGFLGQEDPLERGMATHCSILAWKILWTEKPGGLQSTGSQSRTWLGHQPPPPVWRRTAEIRWGRSGRSRSAALSPAPCASPHFLRIQMPRKSCWPCWRRVRFCPWPLAAPESCPPARAAPSPTTSCRWRRLTQVVLPAFCLPAAWFLGLALPRHWRSGDPEKGQVRGAGFVRREDPPWLRACGSFP